MVRWMSSSLAPSPCMWCQGGDHREEGVTNGSLTGRWGNLASSGDEASSDSFRNFSDSDDIELDADDNEDDDEDDDDGEGDGDGDNGEREDGNDGDNGEDEEDDDDEDPDDHIGSTPRHGHREGYDSDELVLQELSDTSSDNSSLGRM